MNVRYSILTPLPICLLPICLLPICLLSIFVIFSCNKGPDFSSTPRIVFESIKVIQNTRGKDTLAKISFKVFDGDGDLGNPLSTNATRDNKDIFFIKFRKVNKEFIEIILDTVAPYEPNTTQYPYVYSLPPGITPSGKNKQIEAIIDVFDLFIRPGFPMLQNDTIKYKIRIKDRRDHFSNEIETSEMVVKK